MKQFPILLKDGARQIFLKLTTKTIPSLFLSSALFVGGIVLLALKIPGWSLLFGLPATQIGIIFLILTFDEVAKGKVGAESLQIIACSICGRPTLTPISQKKDICEDCQERLAKNYKKREG